jgi:Family of unknown function (DUF7005)
VSGLINWDRIAAHRRAWAAAHPGATESQWIEEFDRLSRQKPLYQDRVVLLSTGPYSAVEAGQIGLSPDEWLERSLVIRREHEAVHYFTTRLFGRLRSHALDELLADFVGLLRAFGRYDAATALSFLGLAAWPEVRPTGRFVNYTSGVLSDAAQVVVGGLVATAARRLQTLVNDGQIETWPLPRLAGAVAALACGTLEELAFDPVTLDPPVADFSKER